MGLSAHVTVDLPAIAVPKPETVASVPLVVDLDGTLIRTDMLLESSVRLFREAPIDSLRIPFWLWRGKANLKRELALRTRFDAAALPYNEELLQWLRLQRQAGRRLILCTAADGLLARAIAAHCGLFDDVMASDGVQNLKGSAKATALVRRFGPGGFDYAGNSQADLAVWRVARNAVVVDAGPALGASVHASFDVEKDFPAATPWSLPRWGRILRVHQWLKNLLLFVPLLAAHQVGDAAAWTELLWGFAAFCLCASSVYIANDLMDLESDRYHPRKRTRPFASGESTIGTGMLLVPVLALAGLVLASFVNTAFLAWVVAYFALTWAYSFRLKRVVLVDCLTLAALYTLRVVAGAAAAGVALSFWLLAFSGFLFLSLGFVKRCAELQVQQAAGNDRAHGRGYLTSDAPLIQTLGIASGYTSVVVLALYLNSEAVLRLYRAPELVWACVPIMLYWISWLWLRTSRGEMHDDPLVFAFKDANSWAAGALFGAALVLGSVGLQ